MKTNSVEAYVSSLTVVEIRKLGSRYGVKNASKYKRDVLIPMVVEAIIKDQQEKAKQILMQLMLRATC